MGVAERRYRSLTLLVVAEVAAMSLWFVSSAVLGDVRREADLSPVLAAWLASSVQLGFVIGALGSAVTGLADRIDPRRVFAASAALAAAANAALLVVPAGPTWVPFRLLTGIALAGVYPVGMKIAVGWSERHRGLLVGLLVGGLTLGSAAPHLFAWLGGSDWRLATAVASLAAAGAALAVLGTSLGPYHVRSVAFRPEALGIAWSDRRLRAAYLGYFGHMWELYALWAWMAVALTASYAVRLPVDEARELAKLVTFVAIAAGGLACPPAGWLADRIGKARLTIVAMAISGTAALLAAVSFGGPVAWMSLVMLVWGIAVIPDSAQFSALIADHAPPEFAGSLMALQTAIGFALTVVTVQLTPPLASTLGWPVAFALMALGPLVGIVAMRPLAGRPG